ncbi:CvpA family protein [Candidatus Uhrbacteria bacterium]|nr:CvpA family protein [Candidatus Uhrbacteria bacterium]
MLLVDIILLLILLGFIGAGAKDGFVHTLGRLVGAVIGFVVAKLYYVKFGVLLALFMPTAWANFCSFALLFILITRLSGFLLKLIDGAISILKVLPFLKSIDKILGGILGMVEGVLIMGGIFFVLNVIKILPSVAQWITGSKVAFYIQTVFETLMVVLL